MLLLRYNRRLLWTALAAGLWAYLGIAAALAQAGPGPAGPPAPGQRFGLHLRLPPGAVMLPGRLVEVREEEEMLHLALAVPEQVGHELHGPDGEPVSTAPEGVELEFLTPQQAQGRELTISTLRGVDRPLRLPGGREVIVAERYFIGLGPRGAALIPHGGEGVRLLDEQRGLWDNGPRGPEDGGPPPGGPGRAGRPGHRHQRPRDLRREHRHQRLHEHGWHWPWEQKRPNPGSVPPSPGAGDQPAGDASAPAAAPQGF